MTSKTISPAPITYISIQDAAARIGVHPKTIRRYVSRGLLPAVRVAGHLIRIPVDALDALGRPLTVPADGAA